MKKKLPYKTIVICSIIVIVYFAVYTVLTPFIRGVVIDAETKKPVENAWVMATVDVDTRTIAGNVGSTYAISRRHLRTGKDGVFTISPKMYLSIPTPFTFGNTGRELNITIRVMGGKRAEMDFTKSWWKIILFATTPVKYMDRKDDDISFELRTLYDYCTTGTFFMIYRSGSERCDNWELDYTIVEHERFIKKLGQPKNVDQETYYSKATGCLSGLFKRKDNYEKALEYLKTSRDFDKKRGLSISSEDETEINELEKKLKSK